MRNVFSCLLLGVLLISSTACVSTERYDAASQEIENQDEVIRGLRRSNSGTSSQLGGLRNQLELAQLEIARLKGNEGAVAELERLRREFAELRTKFTSIDEAVTLTHTPEGTALTVEGEVLFETASDRVSSRGEEILRKIATRLMETTTRIRVDGHTDNVPIVKKKGQYPLGNLQLSGARSMRVAWFMMEKCGFPRDRVSFAGYGSERPVASNADDAGRRRNRRVEILLLGE
ncbi:MAG: flagellar motor protein MotB [Planctomycetota bacterium]|jgi:flagellar motor protein MotB